MAQDHGLVEDEAVVLWSAHWAPLMRRSSSAARIAARLAARRGAEWRPCLSAFVFAG
jgi:hypothetical protein